MDPSGVRAEQGEWGEGRRPAEPSREALEVFAAHLSGIEAGAPQDFAALCAAHPGLAGELAQLEAEWVRVHALLERLSPPPGFSATLRARYELDTRDGGSPGSEGPSVGGALAGGPDAVAAWLAARAPSTRRYRTRREVARGGMGVILEVWDEDLRRRLAMKVVLERARASAADDSGAPRRLARFLEEAQITSQLDHPGIVPVHEVGRDEAGRIFFTMRLVDGRDLREVIELARAGREGWTRTRVLGALLKVCEAMAYAHSKNVVHRDLKPANVMVGRFGETYVMDWGLAKVLGRRDPHDLRLAVEPRAHGQHDAERAGEDGRRAERPSLDPVVTLRSDSTHGADSPLRTLDGDIVGTPAYMAPEQAQGRLDEVGPRSDIYSVGSLLYHLLAGHMPYEPLGETVRATAILEAVRAGPPWPLRKLDPTLPAELVAIAEKAMARDPLERYASMMDMAEDLRAYLEGRVVSAYTSGVLYEARKWVERNQGVAAALFALVLLAVGSGVFFVWQQAQNLEQLGREQAATSLALERAIDAEDELRSKVEELESTQRQLLSARDRADEKAREALEQQRHAFEQRDVAARNASRAERQTYRANLIAAESSLRLEELPRASAALDACEPALRGWEWRHLALQTDESVQSWARLFSGAASVCLGADGRLVVSAGHDRVHALVHELSTGRTVRLPGGILPAFLGPAPRQVAALSPNGLSAATSLGREVQLWNALEGRPLLRLVGHEGPVTSVAWSADGRRLLTTSEDGSVRVWEPLTGRAVAVLTGGEGPLRAAAIDADGRTVVAGGDDRLVRVWDLEGDGNAPRLVHALGGHSRPITDLVWSPTERSFCASASEDGTLIVWNVEEGGKHTMLRGHVGAVHACAFTIDGRRVISGGADGTLRLWATETGEGLRVLRGHGQPVVAVLGLADGRVASASLDGSVRQWDLDWRPEGLELEAWGSVAALGHDPARGWVLAWPQRGGSRGWVAETGELLFVHARTEAGPARSATAVAYSPDGRFVAEGSLRGPVSLLRTAGGELARSIEAEHGGASALAFSGDGRWLAWIAGDEGVYVLDLEDPASVPRRPAEGPRRTRVLALSHDGTLLAAASADEAVRVFDLVEGRTVALFSRAHPRRVTAMAFDPRGERLLTASQDGTIAVRRIQERDVALRLVGHDSEVLSVAFDPQGQRIASGARDGGVRVWDPLWGDVLLALGGHAGAVTAVAFSADGQRLLSGDDRGAVRIWESSPAAPRYAQLERSRRVQREAGVLVDSLYERLNWSALVVSALEANRTLESEMRAASLRLARIRAADPLFLAGKAYEVLLQPASAPKDLSAAVAAARAAHDIRPDLPVTSGVLGAALVRAGELDAGLGLLELAIRERRTRNLPPDGRDFGFRALARLERGEPLGVREDLERLRSLAEQLPSTERTAAYVLGRELEGRLEALVGTEGEGS